MNFFFINSSSLPWRLLSIHDTLWPRIWQINYMPQEELPALAGSDSSPPAPFGAHPIGAHLSPCASSWVALHPPALVLLTYGGCDQWAGTFAVTELKLSSLATLLQCSSPSFAGLILHTWSVLNRYLRQDSDQLTHFGVTIQLGVLFSRDLLVCTRRKAAGHEGRRRLSLPEHDACPASARHE